MFSAIFIQPKMNQTRKSLVTRAFNKLDKTGDGIITVEDLKGVYNVKKHKKYLNGEWTEEQCLGEFLKSFDTPNEADGQVTISTNTNSFCILFHHICNFLFPFWTILFLPLIYFT